VLTLNTHTGCSKKLDGEIVRVRKRACDRSKAMKRR
jgi:hypothetical protein